MNTFDSISERKRAVKAVKEEMEKKLDFYCFNPITKQYMTSNSEELRPDLFLYEALKIAQTKVFGSKSHLDDIIGAVKRIEPFIVKLRYEYIFIKDIKIWHIKNLLYSMKLTASVYNKYRSYLMSIFKELIQYAVLRIIQFGI